MKNFCFEQIFIFQEKHHKMLLNECWKKAPGIHYSLLFEKKAKKYGIVFFNFDFQMFSDDSNLSVMNEKEPRVNCMQRSLPSLIHLQVH